MPPAEFMRRRNFALASMWQTAMRVYIMNSKIHDIIASQMRLLYASGGIYAPPKFCPCINVANGDARLYHEFV